MITLLGFVVGLFMVVVGFFMVWKSYGWQQNVGGLNIILGYPRLSWLDWDTLGIILMVFGVLTMFGLVQSFLALTVGKILSLR